MFLSYMCYMFLSNISPYHSNIDLNSIHYHIHLMLAISITNQSIFYVYKVYPELSFSELYLFISMVSL